MADHRTRITSLRGEHIDEVRALFREYEAFLGIDLCFQDFEQELAELPGEYAPPSGSLLLARVDGRTAGCVALRRLEEDACEMKRLFVRPAFRGLGLGRRLAERVVEDAREKGYRWMLLDTFGFLEGAIHIYEQLGFRQTVSYYDNPNDDVQYWVLDLARTDQDT